MSRYSLALCSAAVILYERSSIGNTKDGLAMFRLSGYLNYPGYLECVGTSMRTQ